MNFLLTVDVLDKNRELFSEDVIVGNLQAIDKPARFMSSIVLWITSFAGFFIVAATLARLALHGIYAAYPHPFDKLHEMKIAMRDNVNGWQEGGRGRKAVKGIAAFIVDILPDLKASTEFIDERLTVGAFFTKALPAGVVGIFLGSFIFVGYHGKVANKISDFGLVAVENTILQLDPRAIIDSSNLDFLYSPDFLSKNASDSRNKEVFNATKALFSSVNSYANDMSKANKQTVANELDAYAQELIGKLWSDSEFLQRYNRKGYTVSYSVVGTNSYANDEQRLPIKAIAWDSDQKSTGRINTVIEMSKLNTGSAKKDLPTYVVVTANINKVAENTEKQIDNKVLRIIVAAGDSTNLGVGPYKVDKDGKSDAYKLLFNPTSFKTYLTAGTKFTNNGVEYVLVDDAGAQNTEVAKNTLLATAKEGSAGVNSKYVLRLRSKVEGKEISINISPELWVLTEKDNAKRNDGIEYTGIGYYVISGDKWKKLEFSNAIASYLDYSKSSVSTEKKDN